MIIVACNLIIILISSYLSEFILLGFQLVFDLIRGKSINLFRFDKWASITVEIQGKFCNIILKFGHSRKLLIKI